ncbi:endonuclease-reverse transcriptase, partial [Clarias magur]
MDCAKEMCPTCHRTRPWISDECLELVNERKRVKLLNVKRYRQLNQVIPRRMKEEREAYWNQVSADLEQAASKHEYHTLYRTLRLSGKVKSTKDNIRNADGTFVRSPTERLQRWRQFFEELYNHIPPQGPQSEPPRIDPPEVDMSDTEPTLDEVRTTVRTLKTGKAP